MTMHFPFDNSYARLPARFYARQNPVPVAQPALLAVNWDLADELGIDLPDDPDKLAAIFAGNDIPDGAAPLAQVYAGHQFGGWSPQLGDGRAVMLGEITPPAGGRFDIQLKGAGQTPFSRRGDGRAWLGPVLREYILSEAMHRLGIPTTRALAAVTTGEPVYRETAYPGAIFARVAASHIRVGTFQYFAARQDIDALQTLLDHAIARHYPNAHGPEGFLAAIVTAQANLIARWMGVGFIHGVMNTDNMAISGETIDYGPCAFMDAYHPDQVFSSIDTHGRYAYANQPQVATWNLAQLATSLLPLIPDQPAAIERLTAIINGFADQFNHAWHGVLRAKLGMQEPQDGDISLAFDLLDLMARERADFTRVFRALSGPSPGRARAEFATPAAFDTWFDRWAERMAHQDLPDAARRGAMQAVNPARIPRNHQVEQVITAALAGDMAPFARLNAALAAPFDDAPDFADYEDAPTDATRVRHTFCGT